MGSGRSCIVAFSLSCFAALVGSRFDPKNSLELPVRLFRRASDPKEGSKSSQQNGGKVRLRIGVDTGGTFTDFVVVDGNEISIFKVPSTPGSPGRALLKGLDMIEGENPLVQLGSTVGTNAVLEHKGATVALLTNQGFEDIIEIGRQNRPQLYSLMASRAESLVPPSHRIGVRERTSWSGRELIGLEEKSLEWLKGRMDQLRPESIAVTLLYSYLNPTPEKRVAEALQGLDIPISLSHEILPEFREFERTSATVINAYLMPVIASYLQELQDSPLIQSGNLTVMQSNGGTISAERAAREPVRTIASGPAAGVVGAVQLGRRIDLEKVITFDMGGTSTDVCLCDGQIPSTKEAQIGGLPIPVQMIDIQSVGAGGGSIASVDPGGLLKVGPESAGADPGPVCYGKGDQVTVTDANLYLGLIDPEWFLGGEFQLAPNRIGARLKRLADEMETTSGETYDPETVASGIRTIVTGQMERAIRMASLERGYDTREFTLISYGGAGGLHVCDLARSLLIPQIVIPVNPGVLSALGALESDVKRDASRTILKSSKDSNIDDLIKVVFEELGEKVLSEMDVEGFASDQVELERSLDARYVGQSFELNIPLESDIEAAFHQMHERQYGYSNTELPVEVVTLRVTARGQFPSIKLPQFKLESKTPPEDALLQEREVILHEEICLAKFYDRKKLKPGNLISGPAIVLEYSSTSLIAEDFKACVDEWGNLVIGPIQGSY